MNKFVLLYWIGAVFLITGSFLYNLRIINLIPFAILAVLGTDSMLTAVVDFRIRDYYKPREFKHIIISEIAFWIGLVIAFLAFIIRKELLFLGLAIMLMSVFEFILTQKSGAKKGISKVLYREVEKKRKFVSIYKIYLATWFLSAILVVSSMLNNKWITIAFGLAGMLLSFLGYEKARVKRAVTAKKSLLKEKNYVLYGLMWFASALLVLIAFANEMYLTTGIGLMMNILSSLGYHANKPKTAHKFLKRKTQRLTTSMLAVLGFLIIGLGFVLYSFKFINIILLSIISLIGLITILVPLLHFIKFKKKKVVEKRIRFEGKVRDIKKKFLFALEIAYLIGAAFVALGFILFQQQKISLRGLIILAVLGLLIIVITDLIVYRKRHKKVIKEKIESSQREKEVRIYQLKPIRGVSQTQFDELVNLVNKTGIVKVSEVAKKFGIPKQLAEEWGKILEDHKLVTLHYPTLGELELRKWKK